MMTTQGGLQPTSNEANLCTNDNGSQLSTRIVDEIMAGKNVFFGLGADHNYSILFSYLLIVE
jgi:hypothetical protein